MASGKRSPSGLPLRVLALALLAGWCALFAYHVWKPLPSGVSITGPPRSASGMEFLVDLTYQEEGRSVSEQAIFDRVLSLIDEAEEFVVVDMFFFDGEHDGKREYRPLSAQLTEHLVARRTAVPDLKAIFITDEINNFYGAYTSSEIARLRAAGIQVIITNLSRLRDSNPVFSAGWRMLFSWWGTAGLGWLPHPFSSTGRRVTARSYLKVLNFKANHRKLIVTEQGCLVASANPHDASSLHSNIAFAGSGAVCGDVLEAERSVAALSGEEFRDWPTFVPATRPVATGPEAGTVQLVTEGKILTALLEDLSSVGVGDRVDLAMFYLSQREVVEALLEAAARGTSVRLVLDPNKDAFGREKNGIPNRQVAFELTDRSEGRIAVRWYDTQGEQFHTKLVIVSRGDSVTVMGGSANLTRRNIGDYNLEADLRFVVSAETPIALATGEYFDRLFNNRDAAYTLPFDRYRDDSWLRRFRYRVEEFTGACSY